MIVLCSRSAWPLRRAPSGDLCLSGVVSRCVPAQEFGERGEFSGEGRAALGGDAYPGPRTAAGVALLYFDHAGLFQHGEVLGQVAGSQAEGLAQVPEFGALRLGGDREDAEPVPLVHGLIEAVGRVLLARLLRLRIFGRAHLLVRWPRCTANAPAPV